MWPGSSHSWLGRPGLWGNDGGGGRARDKYCVSVLDLGSLGSSHEQVVPRDLRVQENMHLKWPSKMWDIHTTSRGVVSKQHALET